MNMTRKRPDSKRGTRRLRVAGALVVASLAAPLGLATVASPAGAAPVTIRVAGDAATVNAGGWVWGGSDYSQLRGLITSTDFGDATFQDLGGLDPTAANLANVDVFFSGAVPSGYSGDREQAILNWIDDGGVFIANPQHPDLWNTADFLGAPVGPVAQWEEAVQPEDPEPGDPAVPNTHSCPQNVPASGTNDCFGINDYLRNHSAPQPATIPNPGNAAVAPLVNGPWGVVDASNPVRNWHTVTTFAALPAGAVEVAHLRTTCTADTTACSGPGSFAYENNLDGTVVAVVPFGTTFGAGAVVLASDGDVFSNAYGLMAPGNQRLALNLFQWIGDHFALEAEPPPPVVPGQDADAKGLYNPVSPDRIFDTRTGVGTAAGKIGGNSTRDVQVTGVAGVPADATAVALNVTATNQAAASVLTVYPAGQGRPNTSNLNVPAEKKDIANAVAVRVGAGGKVSIYNENNATDVIVDVVGYWSETGGDRLTAISAPTRVFDTRDGTGTQQGAIGEGGVRTVSVAAAGVPSGATGVVANVTATNGTRGGFLTVFPSGNVPSTSSVNFLPNANVPNLVFAPLAADGTMQIANAFGSTDVIVDVVGYFAPGGTTRLAAVAPDRLLDTRSTGKVTPNGTVEFDVRGRGGVDASAQSVLLNVTVNEPGAAGFLTAFPEGGVPNASNVNFAPNQTVPNLVLARIGSDGKVRIANTSPGASNIIADVFAWFGPGV
jgi:hypothetical protein